MDSEKENLGLTIWKNSPKGKIMKYDIAIAKNYLNEEEFKKLERFTLTFLDYAEDMALEHSIMTMQKWIDIVDDLLKFRRKNILKGSGSVTHDEAVNKAEEEYDKFRQKQDKKYVSSMDDTRYLNEMCEEYKVSRSV